jgi:hypothetical protein
MYGEDERDRVAALSEMERYARTRSNFDQVAARETFKSYLQADRRFDGYDLDRPVCAGSESLRSRYRSRRSRAPRTGTEAARPEILTRWPYASLRNPPSPLRLPTEAAKCR